MQERNLIMPGNPRYQPPLLTPYFGYDNNYRGVAEVELACLDELHEIGLIPDEDYALLTDEVRAAVLGITATATDLREQQTKHDMRAWVQLAQELMDPRLGRLLHIPMTSYDALDTGRILMYKRAHDQVVRPLALRVIGMMGGLVTDFADQVQIGRTHGQAAVPITVGFWLATITHRLITNFNEMERCAGNLVGKISGAVGAYNAQVALGIAERCGSEPFETRVLARLGLKPAAISTQILPPEPLAYHLHSCAMMGSALGQLGRDGRNLMRSEIAELVVAKEPGQVGSSTMPHKNNPIVFEQLEGMALRSWAVYHEVVSTLISEHQRDLVGSSPARDFAEIIVNLVCQLNALVKQSASGVPFLRRLAINTDACQANLTRVAHLVMAEPIYIALQMAGYLDDAHALINDELAPRAYRSGRPIAELLVEAAAENEELYVALGRIPPEVRELFPQPGRYTGLAREKALEIAALAETVLGTFKGA